MARKALALLLTLMTAGCLGTSTPTAPLAAPPAAWPGLHVIGLEGCDELAAVAPVQVQGSLADQLPPGFTPVFLDPAQQIALHFVTSYACTAHDGLAATGTEVREAIGMLLVVPPKEFAVDDVSIYGVVLRPQLGGTYAVSLATTSPAHAAAYRAWGLGQPADANHVTLDIVEDTPAARVGQSEAQMRGFVLRQTSTAVGLEQPLEGGAARLFGVENKTVTGAMDVNWTAAPGRSGGSLLQFDDPTGTLPPAYPAQALQQHAPSYNWVLAHAMPGQATRAPTQDDALRAIEERFPGLAAERREGWPAVAGEHRLFEAR